MPSYGHSLRLLRTVFAGVCLIVAEACGGSASLPSLPALIIPGQASLPADAPNPCTMASAGELTQATKVPFGDGALLPEVDPPTCEWRLKPSNDIQAADGYTSIFLSERDASAIALQGTNTTIGGHPALMSSGEDTGTAYIDMGNGLVVRVELALGPNPESIYNVTVSDVMQKVAEVVASHI